MKNACYLITPLLSHWWHRSLGTLIISHTRLCATAIRPKKREAEWAKRHSFHSLTPSKPIDMGLMADLRGSEVWYRFIYILLCDCVYDNFRAFLGWNCASASSSLTMAPCFLSHGSVALLPFSFFLLCWNIDSCTGPTWGWFAQFSFGEVFPTYTVWTFQRHHSSVSQSSSS